MEPGAAVSSYRGGSNRGLAPLRNTSPADLFVRVPSAEQHRRVRRGTSRASGQHGLHALRPTGSCRSEKNPASRAPRVGHHCSAWDEIAIGMSCGLPPRSWQSDPRNASPVPDRGVVRWVRCRCPWRYAPAGLRL